MGTILYQYTTEQKNFTCKYILCSYIFYHIVSILFVQYNLHKYKDTIALGVKIWYSPVGENVSLHLCGKDTFTVVTKKHCGLDTFMIVSSPVCGNVSLHLCGKDTLPVLPKSTVVWTHLYVSKPGE